jgi:hypothetical protein
MHGLWTVEFSNGRLRASHYCSDRVVFGYSLPPLCTADLVTQRFQANEHSLPATFTYPVGPSASSFNSSTAQKPRTAQNYTNFNKHYIHINSSPLCTYRTITTTLTFFANIPYTILKIFGLDALPPPPFLQMRVLVSPLPRKQETVCLRQISAVG